MKRTIVITLIGLMFACVLPMAQAQDNTASKSSDNAATQQASDQFQKEMDQLRQQMEQLQEQMQQLAKKMAETSVERANLARHEMPSVPTVPHVPQVNVSIPDMPHLPADIEHHAGKMDANMVEATVEGEYSVKSVKPDTILEIQNSVGSITIQGSDQKDCTVKTVIKAKGKTKEEAEEIARKVQIQVTPTDDRVHVSAKLPEKLRNSDGNDIQVIFELTVPRQVRVKAAQQVGNIRLVSLDGDVEAKTNVGNIDLAVPAGASAKLNARTQVGAITSDLPLDITGKAILKGGGLETALGSRATGVLGGGQHKLDLQSQVGIIKIRSETSTVSHQF